MQEQFLGTKKYLTSNISYKINKVTPFAEIWESPVTSQKSLHATVNLKPGDILNSISAKEIRNAPTYLTVQINEREHIMLDPEFLQYINHSCRPNVFFNTKYMVIICIRPIEVGKEITFFYPSTEWSMAQSFTCHCQTEDCLGIIQGSAHIHPHILERYNLSEHVKQNLRHKYS